MPAAFVRPRHRHRLHHAGDRDASCPVLRKPYTMQALLEALACAAGEQRVPHAS